MLSIGATEKGGLIVPTWQKCPECGKRWTPNMVCDKCADKLGRAYVEAAGLNVCNPAIVWADDSPREVKP